jgi:NADH-quinone oxidoreductase subunit C
MSDVTSTEADADAAAEPADEPLRVHGCLAVETLGQLVIHPSQSQYVDLIRKLADDGYAMCVDLTAVDYLGFMQRSLPDGVTAERLEVVVNLLDMDHRRRIRLRVQVPESEPSLPSLFDIHPGTEAMEREVFDMFGIAFEGHPDPSRILMPEDWIGHPLRKDYEIGDIPVQFKGAPA